MKISDLLCSPRKPSISKRREEIENCKSSIDFLTSWKRFPRTVQTFEEYALEALKRNVKMRVILEKPPNQKFSLELTKRLKKMPNYKIRYINYHPKAIMAIFDKKRAIIKTSVSVGLAEAPSLWTNNPCVLSVFNQFFDLKWNQAMNKIPKTIKK